MKLEQPEKFNGVDWSQSNVAIAKSLSMSDVTVRKARMLLAKNTMPATRGRPIGLSSPEKFDGVDWSQNNSAIARSRPSGTRRQ